MLKIKPLVLAITFAWMTTSSPARQATDEVLPEPSSSTSTAKAGKQLTAQKWMVSAANPHAARAGAKILRAGGTAADAAIAIQLVLGLVEPQSSGLGGGAFVIYFNAKTGRLTTLDGRETAPFLATPRLFQDAEGKPLRFFDAVIGGRSVGVPGTPKLLETLHQRWGKTKWATLFDDAIHLAENGFAVSPRLEKLIARDAKRLAVHPVTSAYFLPGGTPLKAGFILKNPAYAASLKQFLKHGSAPFYRGTIASDIVLTVQRAENRGLLHSKDLERYQVIERPAVCAPYRQHDVCGMGPPSSGALTVGQILGILAPFDLASLGPDNAESWRLIGEASRLAFADRGRYMADSDYVPLPLKGLLDPAYLATRAALIRPGTIIDKVRAGTPKWDHAFNLADDAPIDLPSTSHFSIVDQYGNALSMTTTIENGFGSRLMVDGFLLNNELTDFSFRSHRNGIPVANRVEPGKRPRSSMSPTIVMKDGKPSFIIGSPGGSRIINYVAKTIIARIDWGMNVQQAIALPHLVNRFGTYDIEKSTSAEALAASLKAFGYKTKTRNLNSGLHGIAIDANGMHGGADPRREGHVIGE